jgi:SAM-dependent methyltransferase
MALGRDVVDAIIREHSYRPITGDVLLIGQQNVSLSRSDVLDVLRDHRVAPVGDRGDGDGDMSAAALFRLLGVGAVRTLDSHAETADIVHDLDEPIPARLKGSTDFIIDNGAIGDVFSAATALRNHAELLRPGGRLIAVSNLSGHFDPYSIPSAVWYLDYFVINEFADCKVYILVYIPDWQPNAFYLNIGCLLDPAQEIRTFLSSNEMSVVVFAEKAAASTVHGTPTHARLRSPNEWERYRSNLSRINQSPRPHLVRSRGVIGDLDVRGGHLFVNRDYVAISPSQARREADETHA